MAVDDTDVEKVATLARLSLNPDEYAHYTHTFNQILALVDAMQTVDTEQVAPLAHPLEASLYLRDDIVTETDQHDALQTIAPKVAMHLYLVPKVIE